MFCAQRRVFVVSKFNRRGMVPGKPASIIVTNDKAMPTHQGGSGFARSEKSELFLLAVSTMGATKTFYEDALGRDTRFVDLVRRMAVKDPLWTANLALWLRREGMRSAPIVIAAEYARASTRTVGGTKGVAVWAGAFEPELLPGGGYAQAPSGRKLIADVCLRSDEPGEVLAYWLSAFGRPIPKAVTRGLGDAALKLFNEYTAGSWDKKTAPVRYADVIELSQISRARAEAGPGTLFKFLLDERRGRGSVEGLPMLERRRRILTMPAGERAAALASPEFRAQARAAGLSWEALSGWVPDMDARAWECASQLMGYIGLLRNLNNFSRAGVSPSVREEIAGRLTLADQARRAGVLPMQFLAAYLNVVDDAWKPVLNTAMDLALEAVPLLAGKTLVLIDVSGSMADEYRPEGMRKMPGAEHLKRWDVAALFGLALARRCEDATVVAFSHFAQRFDPVGGESVLRSVDRFRRSHLHGGGTDTAGAVRAAYAGHDRVVVLTDEQHQWAGRTTAFWPYSRLAGVEDLYARVPARVPVHTFNLAGYAPAGSRSGANRFTVGGLSDAGFKMIGLLEAGRGDRWPWELAG